jgi:N-acetylneuraminate synthase
MSFEPSSSISINGRKISKSDPVYFIAEIGSNFDRDLTRAKDLIYLAKEAGADAVKFQHYAADSLVSDYGFKTLRNGQSHQSAWKNSVYQTYENAALNKEWTAILKDECDKAGMTFLTSPYSLDLVDYVDPYVPAYKVGSGDITWPEIIEKMSSKKKPIMLATGASTLADVRRSADLILSMNPDLILMQCNTNYTVDIENFKHIQLNVLRAYERLYPGIVLGLSDHTPGNVSVLGAVALGARVIEKHFTDSNDREGPDHLFAMNPKSWREMVDRTRDLDMCLGSEEKKIESNEQTTAIVQRRSLCASRNLRAGDELHEDDISILRPCPPDAIAPYDMSRLIGGRIMRDIHAGEFITWIDIDGN